MRIHPQFSLLVQQQGKAQGLPKEVTRSGFFGKGRHEPPPSSSPAPLTRSLDAPIGSAPSIGEPRLGEAVRAVVGVLCARAHTVQCPRSWTPRPFH